MVDRQNSTELEANELTASHATGSGEPVGETAVSMPLGRVKSAVAVEEPGDAEPADIDDAEAAKRLADLHKLVDLMRPAVQADGGDLVLTSVDVRTGVVAVQLEGACSSCAVSSTTLEAGVERLLTQRLSWVTEVQGGVQATDDWEASAALGKGGWVAAEPS